MKNLKVKCGDWHLGWGFGGNDHIGKLEHVTDNMYRWTGMREGRHGNIIRRRYSVDFTITEGTDKQLMINIIGKDSDLPAKSEVISAVNQLKNQSL